MNHTQQMQEEALIFAANCMAVIIDRFRRKGWDLPPRQRRMLISGAIANTYEEYIQTGLLKDAALEGEEC